MSLNEPTLRSIRIEGFRSLEDVTLELGELLVLVGENGAGKSAIGEALSLLALAAQPSADFPHQVGRIHGPFARFARNGTSKVCLTATLDDGGRRCQYRLLLAARPGESWLRIEAEEYSDGTHSLWSRDARTPELVTKLGAFALADEAVGRVQRQLAAIHVFGGVQTTPVWLGGTHPRAGGPAAPELATLLASGGDNLTNVIYSILADPDRHQEFLAALRPGLGNDLRDVKIAPRGQANEVALFFSAGRRTLDQLSSGQLSFVGLACVAVAESQPSLLFVDEPEKHLHPDLAVRALWLLERASRRFPIIVATHSDSMLDGLGNPSESIRVASLTSNHATVLERLDAAVLDQWRSTFAGVGGIRREGMLPEAVQS